MVDERFEKIKNAFLDNFEGCKIFNATTDLEVEFQHEADSKWFFENIYYPKNLEEDEYFIDPILETKGLGSAEHITKTGHIFKFKVLNTDNLINMLNNR